MSNPIDEYVKRNLANQEITPSKNLFADNIQPRIEQRKVATFPFLRVAAALAILLAAYPLVRLAMEPTEAQYQPQELSPFAIEVQQEIPPISMQPPAENQVAHEGPGNTEKMPGNSVALQERKADQIPSVVKDALPEVLKTVAVAETGSEDDARLENAGKTSMKSYKIKIKIDPAKYGAVEPASTEVARATPTVGDYARQQFQNIKEGEALQAPPKEMLSLPKLAIRFEGNPLKKVLTNKE
jgi:hypothetical protein